MAFIPSDAIKRAAENFAKLEEKVAQGKKRAADIAREQRQTALKAAYGAEAMATLALGSYARGRWGDGDGIDVRVAKLPLDLIVGAGLVAAAVWTQKKESEKEAETNNHLLSLGSGFIGSFVAAKATQFGARSKAAPPPAVQGDFYGSVGGVPSVPELIGPVPAYGSPATYHRPSYRVGGALTDAELAAYAAGHY